VEPIIGGNNFDGRFCYRRRLANHKIFPITDRKTLPRNSSTTSTFWVMGFNIYFLISCIVSRKPRHTFAAT
jgi:hypothetical protein